MAQQNEPMVELSTSRESLPVKLTHEEREERLSQALAQIKRSGAARANEASLKFKAKEAKEEADSADMEAKRLMGIVEAGAEYRSVECVEVYDETTQTVRRVRADTNEPSEPSMAAGLKLMQEHMRQRDQAKACIQKAEQERDDLAAANLAANKRIEALEHERDAARADFARLTTPRPIAEAPRDGTWILGCWPESNEWLPIVMHWTGKEWQREDPAERDEGYMPTHYLPLPEVKP